MITGVQGLRSSFTVICETSTFVLIKDNDDPEYASVTNAAWYTVGKLAESCDLRNRRVIYQDSMGRFDELAHEDGTFKAFRPLTESQQGFFRDLLSKMRV